MTALIKLAILNIHFGILCLLKRESVNSMFPFAKRDISEWDLRYETENY